MITIIDYGMGNKKSIQNAIHYIGEECEITGDSVKIANSSKLLLPGVGSFFKAMSVLNDTGLKEIIRKTVLQKQVPILGICLGMQLLMEQGEEDGKSCGLGLIKGKVVKISVDNNEIKVPHVGFNSTIMKDNKLFHGIPNEVDFYYVHSYQVICDENKDIAAWTFHGDKVVAAVEKENIFGTQFHPEKSQGYGLRVLKNFCEIR